MINPYTQDTLEATIRMNHGLLKYINRDVEEATDQIEEPGHTSEMEERGLNTS